MRIRCLAACLLLLTLPLTAHAESIVLRDSIGPDNTLTNGNPGGSTLHGGGPWNTPGMVFDVPESGVVTESRRLRKRPRSRSALESTRPCSTLTKTS